MPPRPPAQPNWQPSEHAWPTATGAYRAVQPQAEQPHGDQARGQAQPPAAPPQSPGRRATGPHRHSTPPAEQDEPGSYPRATDRRPPAARPAQPAQNPPPNQPPRQSPGPPAPQRPAPQRPGDIDPALLTDEMEPVGEEVQRRRRVDDTLARFSAVHEEMVEEERRRRGRMSKILPWVGSDDDLERALTTSQPQSGGGDRIRSTLAPADDPGETGVIGAVGLGGDDEPADDDADAASGQPARADEQLSRLQAKKRRRHHRLTAAGKITAMAAAILVFLVTGAAWGAKVWLDAKITEIDALDEDSAAIRNAAAQSGDQNFLLVGSDTRAGESGNSKVGTAKEVRGARSDTVMVAHIPANRERAVMVSFPRDLEVNRPACQRWDAKTGQYSDRTAPAAEHAKLNSVYAEGGPKCMTKVVQQLTGLAINHFTGIDFSGFKDMVDAVRGVEVCTAEPIEDEILGTVLPKAGRQTISGDTALNYVRARHVVGDPTADYGRIERQQRFLSSLLRKALSQDVLLNPSRLNGFVNAVARATYGENMDVDQLLILAQSLQDLSTGKVTFVTVPTVGYSNDRGNEVLRTDETNQLFKAIIENSPLPGEQHAPKQAGPTPQAQPTPTPAFNEPALNPAVNPQDVKIQVLNAGNTREGIAGTTASALGEQGFQVVQTENATERVAQTVIRYSDASEAKAKTLAASVPGAKLERDPSVAGAVILMLGPDFDGNIGGDGSGQAGGSAPPDVSTVNAADASCS